MPTETERLADYIEAARLMGEVTGRDLLEGIWMRGEHARIRAAGATVAHLLDHDALSILRDRVWEAVRGYCSFADWRNKGDFCVQPPDGLNHFEPDLPSAVAAIHKHWKESK